MSAKSSCSRTSSSQGVPVADAAGAGAGARADPRFKGNAYLGRIPEMTLEIAADRFMKLRAEERQVSAGDALWGVRSQGTHGFCARAVDADVKYEGKLGFMTKSKRFGGVETGALKVFK